MEKALVDIRYYASDVPNEMGKTYPSNCSKFFNFPKLLSLWGARIASLLGASGFSLGDFDHLYINYTNAIPQDTFSFSGRTPEKWLRYIDYGVSFADINALNELQLERFVVHSTFECLEYLCKASSDKIEMIKSASSSVEKYGTEIELPVKAKQTKSYSILVSYKLRPLCASSYGIVKYKDHKTGEVFSKRFVELDGPMDIYPLVGRISVKDDKIVIQPRPSFKASLYTSSYKVPIEIDIRDRNRYG